MRSITMDALRGTVKLVKSAAVQALGEESVRLVRQTMQNGYASPIRDTGALMADVQAQRTGEGSLAVGNTLPYAPLVHNGTERMRARPYLQDAMQTGQEALKAAVVRALERSL